MSPSLPSLCNSPFNPPYIHADWADWLDDLPSQCYKMMYFMLCTSVLSM
jgi:hypothetical protein